MLVENGKIISVGSLEEVKTHSGPLTEWIDVQNKTILPGFNDAHIHLWKIGQLASYMIDLRGVPSISAMQEIIKERTKNLPEDAWITGRGFNEQVLDEKRMPTTADLDAISTTHPIYLIRTCAHIATVNSLALEKAQVTKQTSAPNGGVIGKDGQGNLTGIFYETALGLITKHIPEPTQEQYEHMIALGAKKLLSLGVTSVTDPAVYPELLNAYHSYHKKNKASIRMNVFPILLPDGGDKPYPVPEKYNSDHLNIDTVKFFSDGGLSGKTAALSRPYKNSNDKGVLRLNEEKFYRLSREAQQKGFRIATHAIGDVAIELVINNYKKLHKEFGDTRNRIEHFGLPTSKHIDQMEHYKFVAVPQPVFLNELGNNFISSIDAEYLSFCYPIKTLLNKNIPVAFSTDGPVVSNVNPWSNIKDSIQRKATSGQVISGNESVNLSEALHAYTTGSAFAEGRENVKGKIQTGQLADFIIIDKNPFDLPTHQLDTIQVLQTFVGGENLAPNPSPVENGLSLTENKITSTK